ncbi:hypothetical protein CES85_1094 [Ochrobactrum quorumnocens]|uniref:ParB/Sulfiredoxin domain-containing protein n=1 Tax=Ochrobactrum quorumnocens TaxID=271865 RepID=A0A248UG56_9HYPH|nr:hypothetical protein [[Ochrobactrum] quorumnocens]ASV85725.1 hypothetical protein CES85_1094 [[Ochrobactrum] quorumnocens]
MDIDISAISLDVENFRHKKVKTEREAITVLLSDEKNHKVAALAEDIVDLKGLDPSVRLIVTEDTNNPNQYIVLEGNRRLTALKTLINPSLAINLATHATFRDLSPSFLALNIQKVDCVILDRQEAYKWIKRKHYNAMGGKGTIEWGAIATARADATEGRPPRWMIALSEIAKEGHDDNVLLEGIASKTTTVERVLATAQFGPVLGITFDQKSNSVKAENGNRVAAISLLKTMITDMADKRFIVSAVDDANAQTDFVNRYAHLSVKKQSPKASSLSTTNTITGSTSGGSGSGGTGGAPTGGASVAGAASANSKSSTGTNTPRANPVRDRKTLADKGLSIKNNALNKLYNELRKLKVESNPHIGSAMIRIFTEKATMVFLEDMSVTCRNPGGWLDQGIKLKEKVGAALHVLDPNKKDATLAYARDIANGTKSHAHSLDQLNKAIHDHKALPAPSELITVWDRLHPYFQALFACLKVNGK